MLSRAHKLCWPDLGLWPPRPCRDLAGSPGEQRSRRGECLVRAAPGSQQRSLVCHSARERACHPLLTVQEVLTESVLANSDAPSPSVASRGSFSLRVLPVRSPRWGGGGLGCFRGGRTPRGAPRAGRRVRLLSPGAGGPSTGHQAFPSLPSATWQSSEEVSLPLGSASVSLFRKLREGLETCSNSLVFSIQLFGIRF